MYVCLVRVSWFNIRHGQPQNACRTPYQAIYFRPAPSPIAVSHVVSCCKDSHSYRVSPYRRHMHAVAAGTRSGRDSECRGSRVELSWPCCLWFPNGRVVHKSANGTSFRRRRRACEPNWCCFGSFSTNQSINQSINGSINQVFEVRAEMRTGSNGHCLLLLLSK
jgi:hypothetical protein